MLLVIMGWGMEFAKKISIVTIARTPIDDDLILSNAIAYSIKIHADGFGGFFLMRLLSKPMALLLSTRMGVGGWG